MGEDEAWRRAARDGQIELASEASVDTGRGWLAVAAAFFSSFVVFGVVYRFGVFLKPVAAEFDADPAAAAAFFSQRITAPTATRARGPKRSAARPATAPSP